MGLKDSLIGLMGDFVQLNRNPEFRSKNELNAAGTSGGPPANYRKDRRHSLNITVGAQGPPDTFVRPRTYSVSTHMSMNNNSDSHSVGKGTLSSAKIKANHNRRNSAPCLLKEPPPSFQLSRGPSLNDKKSKLMKQHSADEASPDSSDSENSEHRGHISKQHSPRLNTSGVYRTNSFRQPVAIAEEEEESALPVATSNGNVTIITTRL
uniref:Sterile alpha and TIR motif-containing protein 1 n=1 Tax=Panagrellus redivivus TaxID=6233 RepID=A0A7E4V5D8_PANRE